MSGAGGWHPATAVAEPEETSKGVESYQLATPETRMIGREESGAVRLPLLTATNKSSTGVSRQVTAGACGPRDHDSEILETTHSTQGLSTVGRLGRIETDDETTVNVEGGNAKCEESRTKNCRVQQEHCRENSGGFPTTRADDGGGVSAMFEPGELDPPPIERACDEGDEDSTHENGRDPTSDGEAGGTLDDLELTKKDEEDDEFRGVPNLVEESDED